MKWLKPIDNLLDILPVTIVKDVVNKLLSIDRVEHVDSIPKEDSPL